MFYCTETGQPLGENIAVVCLFSNPDRRLLLSREVLENIPEPLRKPAKCHSIVTGINICNGRIAGKFDENRRITGHPETDFLFSITENNFKTLLPKTWAEFSKTSKAAA